MVVIDIFRGESAPPLGQQAGPYLTATNAVFASLLALVILSLIYHDRPVGTRTRKGITHLQPAWPLVGNIGWILGITSRRVRAVDQLLFAQNEIIGGGQPFALTFPALGGRLTVLNNPAYIQHVQKTNFENYPKGPDFRRSLGDVLGHASIFVADGQPWVTQRKLASRIFSVNNFQTHVQSTIVREIEKLDKLLLDSEAQKGQIQLPDLMFRFTLSSFGRMAFNAELDCLPVEHEGLSKENDFANAFDYTQSVMEGRFMSPLPLFFEYFTSEGRQMRKSIRQLREYCFKIIDARAAEKAMGNEQGASTKGGQDLLGLFMEANLTREELYPVILSFLIAGRDTTAQTLAWFFYEMFKNPEYIKQIRETLVPVLGSSSEQRPMAFDDLKKLPLLQACIYETIRLWPAVPKNSKKVVKDDVIRPMKQSDGGPRVDLPDVFVGAGESIAWSDWVMARMPEVWGPDCCEYKPSRFLEENEKGELKFKEYSQWQFHAFNGGPRLCLGKLLATYEAMAVAAAILGRFDVVYDHEKLSQGAPRGLESLTLPCTPYYVQVKQRRD